MFCAIMYWGTTAYAAITIDSVSTTVSNCTNNGTISVYAKSNSTLFYQIINGPEIRPIQSGIQFAALPKGTYQVMLTNFSNDTTYANVIVAGNYSFPDFVPTFENPICAGSATGKIVGNGNANSGRAPYTWVLTHIQTAVTSTQMLDTFYNLIAGDYSLRMYDSCQSYATRFVSLVDPADSFTITRIYNNMLACDTDQVSIAFNSASGKFTPPYTITISTPNNTYVSTYSQLPLANNNIMTIIDTIAGVTYGQSFTISVIDGCGHTAFASSTLANYDYNVYYPQSVGACQLGYYAQFSYGPNIFGEYNTNFFGSTTIQVRDSTAGLQIDSLVLNQGLYTTPNVLIVNHLYVITFQDRCGHLKTKYFTSPIIDTPYVNVRIQANSCLDSTGSLLISGYNFTSRPMLTILSGPASIQSTKTYFNYRDTIVYPIVYKNNSNGCTSYNPPGICYQLGGMGMGVYQYQMEDTCGHIISGSFSIGPKDIGIFSYRKTIIKGCPGQNKISYDFFRADGFIPWYTKIKEINATHFLDSSNASIVTIDSSIANNWTYKRSGNSTFSNLNAGTYVIVNRPEDNIYSYPYTKNLLYSGMNCTPFYDTIIVPPYQIPSISYATQIKCNGTVNVGLVPDSSTGVPPYSYEIIAGPQTSSVQASRFFQLTQLGNYVARISDTCGFARTFSFFVDTLSFDQVVKVGSSCIGDTAKLVSQPSPYATYIWKRPNGTFYTGDSLLISPVTSTAYGLYEVMKVVNINACRDTFRGTYTLVSNSTTYLRDTICHGQSFMFAGNLLTQSGIYFDTIITSACDSLVELNLTIGRTKIDTITQSICEGQSVIIGVKNYTTAGTYLDTFATSGCDSIRLLNLSVSNVKRDSISLTICAGDTLLIAGKSYILTGIYRDTFTTAGCDSIRLLRLTVGDYFRDSISRIICAGESITIGAKTYSMTGIYRDTFATVSCDSIRVLNLTILPLKLDSINVSFCKGESIVINGHIYEQAGIYFDTIPTSYCDSVIRINITTFVTPLLQIEASSYEVNRSDTIQLTAISGQPLSYQWFTNAILNDVFSPNPTAIVNGSSWIIAQGRNVDNCVVIDSIFIKVDDCEGSIYVPNAFTPNGDGINDVFRIFGHCIKLQQLLIFNRWGEKVWDTDDMEVSWDGYYKGVLQPSGVYVYSLTYFIGNQIELKKLKGSITLVR